MKTLTSSNRVTLAALGLVFGLVGTARAIQVTYQVDMSVQMALGNFNPASDTVFISGNFSSPNWQQSATDGSTNYILAPSSGDANIYVGTFNIVNSVDSSESHQFVINPGGNFSNLQWETGVGDRSFRVPATDTNLPVVFWNNVTNASSIVVNPVTFRVDMSVQTTLGAFHPENGDLVFVAGDWNWTATGSPLSPDVSDTNIWLGTFNLTNTPGTTINYKFLFIPYVGNTTWEKDGVGPGGARNRQFAFPNAATNLPVAYFNNVTNASSLIVVPVTFQVNMAVQDALGLFDPSIDGVTVAGDVSLNNWVANASPLLPSASNPDLYVGTFDVTNSIGSAVSYKFVINGGSRWENNMVGPNGAQNRQFLMPNAATNLPHVYFDNTNNLGNLAISNISGDQATLTWIPGPKIWLQNSTDLAKGWLDVANTQGSNSATLNLTSPMYFRLTGP